MKILILCTSFKIGLISLFVEGKELYHQRLNSPHSQSIFLHLRELSKKIPLNSLDAIICTNGPGSFTGLRVAACIAKTLSFSLSLPLIGIPSLQSYTPHFEGPFINALSANTPGVFIQKGELLKGKECRWQSPELISWQTLEKIAEIQPIYAFEKEKLVEKIAVAKAFTGVESQGEVLYQEGLKAFNNKGFSVKGELDLHYLRPSQAELLLGKVLK